MSAARRKPLTSTRSFSAIVSKSGTRIAPLASKIVSVRSIVTSWPKIESRFSSSETTVMAVIGPSISSSYSTRSAVPVAPVRSPSTTTTCRGAARRLGSRRARA
jgi:hypothetical protein